MKYLKFLGGDFLPIPIPSSIQHYLHTYKSELVVRLCCHKTHSLSRSVFYSALVCFLVEWLKVEHNAVVWDVLGWFRLNEWAHDGYSTNFDVWCYLPPCRVVWFECPFISLHACNRDICLRDLCIQTRNTLWTWDSCALSAALPICSYAITTTYVGRTH